MPSTSWMPCNTVVGPDWNNPNFIKTLDASSAWQSVGGGVTVTPIVCTGFDFSSVPDGATITGIEFRLTSASNQTATYNIRPYSAGAAVGTTESKSAPSSTQTTAFGGTSNLFSWAATAALVKDSGFGASVTVTTSVSTFIFLNYIDARITYTEPTTTTTTTTTSTTTTTTTSTTTTTTTTTTSTTTTTTTATPSTTTTLCYQGETRFGLYSYKPGCGSINPRNSHFKRGSQS